MSEQIHVPPHPPATLPYPCSLGAGATSDFLSPVWAAGPFLERFGPVSGSDGSASHSGLQLRGAGQPNLRKGFLRRLSGSWTHPPAPPLNQDPLLPACLEVCLPLESFFQALALRKALLQAVFLVLQGPKEVSACSLTHLHLGALPSKARGLA